MTTTPAPPHLGAPLEFCWEILPHVSRTFALTIPALREPLRDRVGIAYLLCRIADTVEDRADLAPPVRRALFGCLQHLASDPRDLTARHDLQAMWPPLDNLQHERLVRRAADILDPYADLDETPRRAIGACLTEMISGMAAYPGPADAQGPIHACRDLDDLENYCHVVAGTVGILLSRLFAMELSDEGWLTPDRLEDGRRFGLGLQITNILKDHAADTHRGICYVPKAYQDPATGALTSDGMRILVQRAVEHLEAAQRYAVSLPAAHADMRLFCLWAAHLALGTLGQTARFREGEGTPKLERATVTRILDRARAQVADDAALQDLFEEYRAGVFAS
jgi:farnesyl-diphosphate farnesyltransferase